MSTPDKKPNGDQNEDPMTPGTPNQARAVFETLVKEPNFLSMLEKALNNHGSSPPPPKDEDSDDDDDSKDDEEENKKEDKEEDNKDKDGDDGDESDSSYKILGPGGKRITHKEYAAAKGLAPKGELVKILKRHHSDQTKVAAKVKECTRRFGFNKGIYDIRVGRISKSVLMEVPKAVMAKKARLSEDEQPVVSVTILDIQGFMVTKYQVLGKQGRYMFHFIWADSMERITEFISVLREGYSRDHYPSMQDLEKVFEKYVLDTFKAKGWSDICPGEQPLPYHLYLTKSKEWEDDHKKFPSHLAAPPTKYKHIKKVQIKSGYA